MHTNIVSCFVVLLLDRVANRADPDQTETVRTGSTLLANALTVLSLYVIL